MARFKSASTFLFTLQPTGLKLKLLNVLLLAVLSFATATCLGTAPRCKNNGLKIADTAEQYISLINSLSDTPFFRIWNYFAKPVCAAFSNQNNAGRLVDEIFGTSSWKQKALKSIYIVCVRQNHVLCPRWIASLSSHSAITFEGFISENRKARLNAVLSERTAHLRIVLENIYQAHNASAVLRSCDCFGIQHVHFIENPQQPKNKRWCGPCAAATGSAYIATGEAGNNTVMALQELKQQGYRIVATISRKSQPLSSLPVDKNWPLCFGTEMHGISEEVWQTADEFVLYTDVWFHRKL